MQITTSRPELSAAITWAAKGIGRHPNIPVLAGMRLEVAGDTLTLAGFNYDTTTTVRVAGTDGEPGTVLVNGAQLAGAVKTTPRGTKAKPSRITFTTDNDTLTVECDGITTRLALLDIREYPQLPTAPAGFGGAVNGAEFAGAVTRVGRAAGTDDTLPTLTCIAVHADSSRLTFTATDRYRLASEDVPWTSDYVTAAERQILIPARPLTDFAKICDQAGKITMRTDDQGDELGGLVTLSDGTRTLTVRTTAGAFPKHAGLWPTAPPSVSVTVDAPRLRAAVDRAGKQTERGGPIQLYFRPGRIDVHALGDAGEITSETVPADVALHGDWPQLIVRFTARYLSDTLAGVAGDAWIALPALAQSYRTNYATGERTADGPPSVAKPIKITEPCGGESTYRAIIMPVRTS